MLDQERVAQALYEHDAAQATYRWPSWKCATVRKQNEYLDRAAVAIEAMRKSVS